IKTAVRSSAQLERIYKFIDDEIGAGAQIYIVYPIIEESEKLNLKPLKVGIDVPNASVMLIIDADRFGMSHLHQLRGRVGRGERKSYCILVSDKEKDR